MKILLAGMNVDIDLVEQLRAGEQVDPDALTPETISAAYARISRNPADVNLLRVESREAVEKARKSNETIVFGLGHGSVAEHACFNFDVIGVSRLAIEYLQHFRLASYTEKSQRYIRMDDDGILPVELDTPETKALFLDTVEKQNAFYRYAYREIEKALTDHGEDPKEASLKAKEDGRYGLALAIRGQLGMTVNARTLENMVQKLSAVPLAEVREMARQLHGCCHHLVPSLVKYTEPEAYHFDNERLGNIIGSTVPQLSAGPVEPVKLLDHASDPDQRILAALLFHLGNGSMQQSVDAAAAMTTERRLSLFKELFRNMKSYHGVRREFENSWFCFEMILSATAFAQLKRHRMGTILTQPYDRSLGVTTPDTFYDACVETGYYKLIAEVDAAHEKLKETNADAADYVLTNGHRRRVLFTVNARELYHFARLRSDEHAQWDIRLLADMAIEQARAIAPGTFMMACGKHRFEETRQEVFGDE